MRYEVLGSTAEHCCCCLCTVPLVVAINKCDKHGVNVVGSISSRLLQCHVIPGPAPHRIE